MLFLKRPCYFTLFFHNFELFVGQWFTGLVPKCSASQAQCCTRWVTNQVYYIRKVIHMNLDMWFKKKKNVLPWNHKFLWKIIKFVGVFLCSFQLKTAANCLYSIDTFFSFAKMLVEACFSNEPWLIWFILFNMVGIWKLKCT